MVDVAIVGGGPAGLAVAVEAARRGLDVQLFERHPRPPDKACGEGLLPRGIARLAYLGALERLGPIRQRRLRALSYRQPDTRPLVARVDALGVRRTALVEALAGLAREAGADLTFGTTVRRWEASGGGVAVDTDSGTVHARLLVLAGGLSPRPNRSGDDRLGIRRHFEIEPWADEVEVRWGDGVEAYLTPVGPRLVGLAFLWWARRFPRPVGFERLLRLFPELRDRLAGAPLGTPPAGAGPFGRRPWQPTSPRAIAVGDAAGAVDPITGEGVSLGLTCAGILGRRLPDLLRRGVPQSALQACRQEIGREVSRARRAASLLLGLSAHPAVRRRAFEVCARSPWLFQAIVDQVAGRGAPVRLALPSGARAASRENGAVTS